MSDHHANFADAKEVAGLRVGGATIIRPANAARIIKDAARLASPGAAYRLETKSRHAVIVERIA